MFRRIFEARGGRVGQYPVLNFQYRIIAHIRSLVGRLAVQNRSFEAGGLDAIAYGIEHARQRGDEELAELFEAQQADEIVHVRFANDVDPAATRQDPRSVLQIGAALDGGVKGLRPGDGPGGHRGGQLSRGCRRPPRGRIHRHRSQAGDPAPRQAGRQPASVGATGVTGRRDDEATPAETISPTTWDSVPAGAGSAPIESGSGEPTHPAARRIHAASSLLLDRAPLLLPVASHLRGQSVFESTIHGSSMAPAIPAGARLQVRLIGPEPCHAGDVVFFLADGGYMVHRVVYLARRGPAVDYLLTRGDRRLAPDPPVRCDRILGTVTAVLGAGGWCPPGASTGGGFCKGAIRAGTLAAMIAVLRASPSLARGLGATLAWIESIGRAVVGRCRRRLQLN